MKQFLKFLLASCTGTLMVLGFLILLFVIIVQVSKPDHSINKSSVLKLEFKDPVPELTDNVPEMAFGFKPTKYLGLREITQLLEEASTDDKIEAILIQSQYPMLGPATAQTIQQSIKTFKESGKPVYAYGDYFSQGGYYLASQADSVFLNPNGFIELRGYAAIIPFFKKLMDKLGIKMNVYYAGKYKSATEPYRQFEMSEENKFQTKEYIHDISRHLIQEVSKARDIPEADLNDIVSNFSSHNAETAIQLGLADRLVYWNDFEEALADRLDENEDAKINYVNLAEYSKHIQQNKKFKNQKNKIALVHLEGEIHYESEENGAIAYDKYARIFQKLKKRDDVKTVVLRINSPGGSALASDLLWNEIVELQNAGKTIVSSMGNYAASGGYYLAAPSEYIFAESNTLTGSIGAYLMIPQITELTEEKIGIHFDTVKTHPYSVIWNPLFNTQDKESQITEQMTEDLYQLFLSRVSDGRNMPMDQVHELAQGRIWSGIDAVGVGLVDEIGGLEEAIRKSAELAELEDYKVLEYPRIEKNIYLEFIASMMEETQVKTEIIPQDISKEYKPLIDYLSTISHQSGPQMRLPFYLELK